jgi:hypothetical protein
MVVAVVAIALDFVHREHRGYKRGFERGQELGYSRGFDMGRRTADNWWIGSEQQVEQARQTIREREER